MIVAASAQAGEQRAFASAIEAMDGDQVRTRIQLLPIGVFTLRDGRGPFRVADRAHADQIVTATQAYAAQQDLMIDYDHQSHFGAKDGVGGTAPASGWIKGLEVDDAGIWAQVAWTDRAAAALKAREYRYLSPLFGFDPSSGRITRLFNAGLTNTPAIDGLPAIAAQVQPIQGTPMDLSKLIALFGLAATATIDDVVAAATAAAVAASKDKEALAAAATALANTGKALGLKADAKIEELVAAASTKASAGNPDPAAFVPIAQFDELKGQVADLQKTGNEGKAAAAVEGAIAAGKVTPAQKEWATAYATKDLSGFETYVAAAAVIVAPGARTPSANPGDAGVTTLTAEQKTAASIAGVSEADYLATLKEDAR